MGSMELNSNGRSLDKKLKKSCLHLLLLRGGGRCVFPPCAWRCLFLNYYIFSFLKGNMYVANCWGVCFETLWKHIHCVPDCGVTLLLRRSSNKISAIRALGGYLVVLSWNPELHRTGLGTHGKGLLLGTVDESWSSLWQYLSEERLNLFLGLWWVGTWVGDYTVLMSVRASTLLLMALNPYLSVLSPTWFFLPAM